MLIDKLLSFMEFKYFSVIKILFVILQSGTVMKILLVIL